MTSILTSIAVAALISVVLGVLGLLLQASKKAEIDKRRGMAAWPVTPGTVADAQVKESRSFMLRPRGIGTISVTWYTPVIDYTYEVMGRPYRSSIYKNSSSGAWRTIYPKVADAIVADHPHGKRVSVTYNPDHPDEAYLALDTGISGQWFLRAISLVMIAAALLLFARSATMLVATMNPQTGAAPMTQEQISRLPAVLPVACDDLRSALQRDQGLTCTAEASVRKRGAVGYKVWTCKNPADTDVLEVVTVLSRESAPEKVDLVVAYVGNPALDKARSALSGLAALVSQQADAQAARDWVTRTAGSLQKADDNAEMNAGGVRYRLFRVADVNGGLQLSIGAEK